MKFDFSITNVTFCSLSIMFVVWAVFYGGKWKIHELL